MTAQPAAAASSADRQGTQPVRPWVPGAGTPPGRPVPGTGLTQLLGQLGPKRQAAISCQQPGPAWQTPVGRPHGSQKPKGRRSHSWRH